MKEVQKIKEFIDSWKERAINHYYEQYVEAHAKYKSFITSKYSSNDYNLFIDDLIHKYGKYIYSIILFYNTKLAKGVIEKDMNLEAKRKEANLIKRVEQAIGEIVDVAELKLGVNQELNGIIIGTKGKCKVETIYAGGYNIQKLHYRILVKKF